MIKFVVGYALGGCWAIFVALSTDTVEVGKKAIIEINKCQEELPRNQKCVLYARAEGE